MAIKKSELYSSLWASCDNILRVASEYLMKNFATERGKSKGQVYTPSEVSSVMAKVLNIQSATNKTTFYYLACGSESLLLKADDEAPNTIATYGWKNDNVTRALDVMINWMHNFANFEIEQRIPSEKGNINHRLMQLIKKLADR